MYDTVKNFLLRICEQVYALLNHLLLSLALNIEVIFKLYFRTIFTADDVEAPLPIFVFTNKILLHFTPKHTSRIRKMQHFAFLTKSKRDTRFFYEVFLFLIFKIF